MFPLLQTIIDYKLANVKMDDIILNIQNITVFGISIYSIYCCVNYYLITGQTINILTPLLGGEGGFPDVFTDTTPSDDIQNCDSYNKSSFIKPFDYLFICVQIYAFIDLFLVKTNDLIIHHLCIFGMKFYNWYNNVDDVNRFLFGYSLLKTEISSIFLVLKYWIPEKTYAHTINALLLYVSFFKFRIFDMYNEIIHGNYVFDIVLNKYTPDSPVISGVLYVSVYGLYLLNAYWFLIMTKILYKQLCKNTAINTDKMCHYICSYIHYVNIPLAAYLYSYNKREQNIFDMTGIVILSIASYMYHYDVYEKIHTKQITEYVVAENSNFVYFLNDSICIHIRSFLAVFTNYYNKPYSYAVTTVCGVFQLSCIYIGFINVIELLSKKAYIKSDFLKIHYIFTFLPIGIDIFAIYLNTKSQEIAIPFLFVNIWIVLLFIVEPFYKLTHVAFHVLLIAQNYYICLTNNNN
jgi:hypothetical protein